MQLNAIRGFGAVMDPNTMVDMLDGTQVQYGQITFDPSTYNFYFDQADIGTDADITDTLPYNIKLTFPGFDPVKNNIAYSIRQRNQTITPGSLTQLDTSTWSLFTGNVSTELGGAANGINNIISNPQQILTGSLGATLGLVLGGAILIYIFTKKK